MEEIAPERLRLVPSRIGLADTESSLSTLDSQQDEENTTQSGSAARPPTPAPKQEDDAMDHIMKSAYLSADYSDMTIICGDEVLHAHKLIVCPQSAYFQRVCEGGFRGVYETIQLPDKEPALMKKVLEYLYTGDYTWDFEKPVIGGTGNTNSRPSGSVTCSKSKASKNTGPDSKALSTQFQQDTPSQGTSEEFTARCLANPPYFHARIFAEADYFMIEALKAKAQRRFAGSLDYILTKAALEETIKEIYSNRGNYEALRKIALQSIVEQSMHTFLSAGDVNFHFVRSLPEFATDLCIEFIRLHDRMPYSSDSEESE